MGLFLKKEKGVTLLKFFLENNKSFFDIEIYPVIIDHNLRQESRKEAYEIENIAKNLEKIDVLEFCKIDINPIFLGPGRPGTL